MRHEYGFDDLLSHVPVADAAKADLRARMSDSSRRYHHIGHLDVLWRRHRRHADAAGLGDPALGTLIAAAIAYHDSVYDAHAHDNEERSAELWLQVSAGCGLSDADRAWVAATIRATHDHLGFAPGPYADLVAADRARLWVLDLDLTPLAELPDEFDRNSRDLRDEVPDLTQEQWRAGAHTFLRHLASAPAIYRTPVLHATYEDRARANIARELADPSR